MRWICQTFWIYIGWTSYWKCSLVKCLLRNLDSINDWLKKIGVYQIAKTTWEDLIPRRRVFKLMLTLSLAVAFHHLIGRASINLKSLWSPKQAVMVVVKIYLALVLSLLLYRKVFKTEKKKPKKRSEPKSD